VLLAAALTIVSCARHDPNLVDASRYDSFWLWAGVHPPAELETAKTVYVLDGEMRGRPARFVPLRPLAPKTHGPEIWLVVRTDTLGWPAGAADALVDRLDGWAKAGNRLAGLQIDFDARTRHLAEYAQFLEHVRRALPPRYRLSITGLMDWSANGDPQSLIKLKGIVDEVVIQTYQERATIPGYERYFDRMRGFPIPFKIGLIKGGEWVEPRNLRSEPNFRGYVVFLTRQTG
jgi:hypothetical protein